MDTDELDNAINDDIAAGDLPVMIAATAGTTNAGVVDPIHDCADVAKNFWNLASR